MPQAPPTDIRIEQFMKEDLDDARVEALAALRLARRREMQPADPHPTPESQARIVREWAPVRLEAGIALATADDAAIAYAHYDVDVDDNPHIVWSDAYVVPAWRRRGIGAVLTRGLMLSAAREGRTTASFGIRSDTALGRAMQALFEASWGLRPRMVERVARLDLGAVDRTAAAVRLAERRARIEPEYRMAFFAMDDLPPPETGFDLADFVDMVEEIENLMPREDMDVRDEHFTVERFHEQVNRERNRGRVIWNVVAQDSTGKAVGLTNVAFDPTDPRLIYQWDTGVRKAHQGRGLATALKLTMLDRIQGALPEAMYIDTENAGSNAAMIAVNSAMGFREHYRRLYYEMPLDAYVARLSVA
jgi:GNAT superfamily N-acetyltransferase